MSTKEQIRNLISNGKTKEAIALFYESLTQNDAELSKNITLQSGRLSGLNDKINAGTISTDDANTEFTNISNSVLNYLSAWDTSDSTSLLDKIINDLPISKDADLGLLSLVNCDRIVPIRKFNSNFEAKKELKQTFQFYFLCGCPDEMPDSIGERIVYEIIEKEGLDLNSSVSYPFFENDFRRLKVENLPLSDLDVSGSKKKLKEYVQKRFAFTNTESFETFIETGIPKLPYNYIFTVFKITETDWEERVDDIFAYLQWMIDTFKCASPKVPTFLFLFVVPFKNMYDSTQLSPRNAAIIDKLKLFCEKNTMAILSDIAPIRSGHFTSWLEKLGVNNPNDSNNVVEVFSKTLDLKDRLSMDEDYKEPRFHMKDIEPLQKKIVEVFRKKA